MESYIKTIQWFLQEQNSTKNMGTCGSLTGAACTHYGSCFGQVFLVFFKKQDNHGTTGDNQDCSWFSAVLAQVLLPVVQSIKLQKALHLASLVFRQTLSPSLCEAV